MKSMQTHTLKTKSEKKDFLENDFIERLIRIEQRVSAKYGSFISYKNTYCYKNLNPQNREKYEKYLNLKKKKKIVFATIFFLPLLGVFMLSRTISGNVVLAGMETGLSLGTLLIISFLLGALCVMGIYFLIGFRRKKRFDPLFSPLEKSAKGEKKKSL